MIVINGLKSIVIIVIIPIVVVIVIVIIIAIMDVGRSVWDLLVSISRMGLAVLGKIIRTLHHCGSCLQVKGELAQ